MTKFDHRISRLQMTILQLVNYLVIFSCVTPAMKKITNLTMNLYILLNSNTANGFRGLYTVDRFREGYLNPFAVLEFSKLIMYYHNITPLIKTSTIYRYNSFPKY